MLNSAEDPECPGAEAESNMVASENPPKEVDEKSAEKPSEAESLKDAKLTAVGRGTWCSL